MSVQIPNKRLRYNHSHKHASKSSSHPPFRYMTNDSTGHIFPTTMSAGSIAAQVTTICFSVRTHLVKNMHIKDLFSKKCAIHWESARGHCTVLLLALFAARFPSQFQAGMGVKTMRAQLRLSPFETLVSLTRTRKHWE